MTGLCFSLPATHVRTFPACSIDGVPDAISALPPLDPITSSQDVVLLRTSMDRYALFEAGPNGQPIQTRPIAKDLRTPQFSAPDAVIFGISGGPRVVLALNGLEDGDLPKPTQGFLEGTRVLGRAGITPIERLSVGDLIWTISNGMQPVRWIVRKPLTITPQSERIRPLRIEKDAFAKGCPTDVFYVLPDHVLGSRDMPIDLPEQPGARPLTAQSLLDGEKVRRKIERDTFELFSIGLDVEDIIYASGMMLEAPQALPKRSAEPSLALQRFKRVFPELDELMMPQAPLEAEMEAGRYSAG